MQALTLPDIHSATSILHVTDESGKSVLEIRKLPSRVLIVADVDGGELYKVKEDSVDLNVSVVDMKSKKVIERFRNKGSDMQISENFKCTSTAIGDVKSKTPVAKINDMLLEINNFENHALLVAVYFAAKKMAFITDGNNGEVVFLSTVGACCPCCPCCLPLVVGLFTSEKY